MAIRIMEHAVAFGGFPRERNALYAPQAAR
jgi:hypothetical protein